MGLDPASFSATLSPCTVNAPAAAALINAFTRPFAPDGKPCDGRSEGESGVHHEFRPVERDAVHVSTTGTARWGRNAGRATGQNGHVLAAAVRCQIARGQTDHNTDATAANVAHVHVIRFTARFRMIGTVPVTVFSARHAGLLVRRDGHDE